MASDSPVISDENNMTHSKSIITGSSLEEHSNYGFHEISSTTVKIQQLKTDLNAENQHERHALTELNEELRLIVDRAHQLELQNSQYMTKLFNLRQQVFINRITGIQTDEHNHVQTNIIKFNYDKVSYESEIELFQLQSKIYEEMLQFETQSIDEQRLKLEQELKQSSSALIDLRKSYTELEQRVGSFRVECKDTFQNMQMVKTQIEFSKKLYTKFTYFSVDMTDFAEFWKLEWVEIIKKIRHDFELLYRTIHQETILFYEKKSKEIQIESEKITEYQQAEHVEHVKILEKVQSEYEEVQKKHSYEKEILMKSEATYSELESNLKTIQIQHNEKFEAQTTELQYLYESIMVMVSSVEEIQRRKNFLESEIIIYRHILGKCQLKNVVETTIITKRTYVVEIQCHGTINIECPFDSTHICLTNQSTNTTIDISRWQLIRRVDSQVVLQYILPDGLQLKPGSELRIYSKLGAEVAEKSSNESIFSSSLYQKIVLNDVYSMGI
ncbi:unnamed protein product [Rotaria sordida]|uniref:LTD domain-containing protein n=1 Tax=Rotaria sordida TaxID=392033 RepID=A0A814IQF5_9BILA|nr:unnamed protein product [Rotaria sordida]